VVANVSGKDVSSALLASLLQGALITVTDHPQAMTHRLERLSRFLLDRTGGEKYATVFYCLIHADGRLVYINAAHPPPLVLRADGDTVDLDASGMPVGMMEDAEFPAMEQRLAPGDNILIYSDGVSEAQDTEGRFFGKKRLLEVVARHARQVAQPFCQCDSGGSRSVYGRRRAVRRHYSADPGIPGVRQRRHQRAPSPAASEPAASEPPIAVSFAGKILRITAM
jgi:serine phosphatase RsbU (regulator of sigma subunit)